MASCSVRVPLPTTRNKDSWRPVPYMLAGMVLGGIAGYLYRDNFDPESTEDEYGFGYIIYPVLGVGIGGLIGGLIGVAIVGR